ncbi:hypothetical protein FISHEDRAFT_60752 [Fistulina hepatica ATCC 64428]|uniref:Glycosyltransferase family 18 catalytic domain-containing protein n=1 Tax=Fistulina hepatica ATCC 64428 TaxID=1128425 RepID=A0A0D7A7L4_9AGAR|nr:hypothetical protein FISHEDRAFT_60752 [Fistulina hepatica ATCC 64428]
MFCPVRIHRRSFFLTVVACAVIYTSSVLYLQPALRSRVLHLAPDLQGAVSSHSKSLQAPVLFSDNDDNYGNEDNGVDDGEEAEVNDSDAWGDPYPYPLLYLPAREDFVKRRDAALNRVRSAQSIDVGVNGALNRKVLWELRLCLESSQRGASDSPCLHAMPKVLVSSYEPMAFALHSRSTEREVIWMRSALSTLRNGGHFHLQIHANETVKVHRLLGDLVTHWWFDETWLLKCIDSSACRQGPDNPEGIPLWKMFAASFMGSKPGDERWGAPSRPWSFNPLGSEWTLTPYRMPDNHYYLGYTIEGCTHSQVVPQHKRENTLKLLAKWASYFDAEETWDPSYYAKVRGKTGLDLVTVAMEPDGGKGELPGGLSSLGRLSKRDYHQLMSHAKAMLGIGLPSLPPSPFAALCLGVPVILPYWGDVSVPTGWDAFDPKIHQHAVAALEGPPYVYSVRIDGPVEDLIKTVQTAVATPIGRYIPPDMTVKALEQRVSRYLNTDWEELARARIQAVADTPDENNEEDEEPVAAGEAAGASQDATPRAPRLPAFLRQWLRDEKERTQQTSWFPDP